jgi:hypothetical protein
MKTALEHFKQLYGVVLLDNQDAAKWIFLSGWNSAIDEMIKRINAMPLGIDTKASFNIYLQELMQLDHG